jgi:lysophospholipase L1-like esterase
MDGAADKRDRASQPFRVAVAFGESTTAGGSATSRERSWVSRLERSISESQSSPVRMLNSGLGANVVSPRSPIYVRSGRPSALERVVPHVVDHRPDLVLVSFGLNDARGGTPLAQFLEDLEAILAAISMGTTALTVLLSTYHITAFDRFHPYDQADIDILRRFNDGIEATATAHDALYADVSAAQGQAPWSVDEDGVHANDLGHLLISNRVFEVLAQNCSCLAQDSIVRARGANPWRDESVLRSID